jgi:general secretion pathway protein A
MYKDYFRLAELPFSIAPDPRFLFLSTRHREALAHLLYGLQGEGGFVLLSGEVGTGKTTVCRCLLEQIPAHCDVALVLNPRLSAAEMLATLCDEFHLPYPAGNTSIKVFVDVLNRFLLASNAAGRKAVLIIDEAQNLDLQVLEQLRLLTNLETNTRKLLQIILLGQPELLPLLERPELRQVAQRVVARYHLTRLSRPEAATYVAHRLRVSGARPGLIPNRLMGRLYAATQGVPRLINLVCDRALLGAYAEGNPEVTAAILDKAAGEVLGTRPARRLAPLAGALASLAAATALAVHLGLPAFGGDGAPGPSAGALPETPPAAAPVAVAPEVASPPVPAVQPIAETPAKPAGDNLAWPADQGFDQAEALAFRALLAHFGVDYRPLAATPACRYAESYGLRCLAGRGDLPALRRIDQPLLLQVRAGGQTYPVALEQLQGESAALSVGGEPRSVLLPELLAQWSGDYVLLWRPPPGYQGPLQPGSQGPAVAWLRQALATVLEQAPAPGAADRYNPALAAQLRLFQAQAGLAADGVAGPLTLLRLNLALDPGLARLVRETTPERTGA